MNKLESKAEKQDKKATKNFNSASEMYKKQESLKTAVVFIVVFLLGFWAGYITKSFTNEPVKENNTNNTYVVENR